MIVSLHLWFFYTLIFPPLILKKCIIFITSIGLKCFLFPLLTFSSFSMYKTFLLIIKEFLKDRLYALEHFWVHNKTEGKWPRFPIDSPHHHIWASSISRAPRPEWFISCSGWTYTDTSVSPKVQGVHQGSLLVYILWVCTNVWHVVHHYSIIWGKFMP